jgi:hypothetical protein
MKKTQISSETKRALKKMVANGDAIDDFYLKFLGTDIPFANSLILIAEQKANSNFLRQLANLAEGPRVPTETSKPKVFSGSKPIRPDEIRKFKKNKKRKTAVQRKAAIPAAKIELQNKGEFRLSNSKRIMKTKQDNSTYSYPTATFVRGGAPGLGK